MVVEPLIIESIELHPPIYIAYQDREHMIEIADLRDWPSGAQRVFFQASNDIAQFTSLVKTGKKQKAITLADTDKLFRLQRVFEAQIEDEEQRFYFAGLPSPIQVAILQGFATITKNRRAEDGDKE